MPNLNDNEQPEDIFNSETKTTSETNLFEESNLYQEPTPTDFMPDSEQKRKKAPKWVIPVCAVIILLITAATAVFCSPTLSNSFALFTLKPTDYYQKVEKKNLSSKIDLFTKSYGMGKKRILEQLKNGMGMEQILNIKVDSTLTDMVGLSDLKSAGLKSTIMYKDGLQQGNFSLLVNDSESPLFNITSNIKDNLIYYLVPDLNKAYLKVSLNDFLEAENYDIDLSYLEDSKKLQSLFMNPPFTEEFLNKTLKKYTQIITSNIKNVSLEKDVSLENTTISEKFTQLNIVLSSKEQYEILEQILKTAQEDSELSDTLANENVITAKEYDQMILKMLEELQAGKDDILNDSTELAITVWVTNKGEIAGRKFSFTKEEKTAILGYYTSKEKSNISSEIWCSIFDKEFLRIKSNGTTIKNAYNGNLDILITNPDTDITNTTKIVIDNYTFDPITSNTNGKFTITNSALGIFSIAANISGDDKKQDLTFELLQGNTNLASLACKYTIIDYKDITFPSDSEKTYNAFTEMEDYLMSSDIEGFITKLKENINIESFSQFIDSYLYY